jgi:hypothetical protein
LCPHLYTAMHPLTCTMWTCVALLTHASVNWHLCTFTPWSTNASTHTSFGVLVHLWTCNSAHFHIGLLLHWVVAEPWGCQKTYNIFPCLTESNAGDVFFVVCFYQSPG